MREVAQWRGLEWDVLHAGHCQQIGDLGTPAGDPLVLVKRQQSMRQAAAATHMSQPAASRMLKEIEDLFGVPFFERLPRGMRPTLYVATMIRHVRMALTNLSQGQDALAALQAGLSGQVDVGVIVTPSMTLVPRAIALTKAEAPQLGIRCLSAPT